LIHFPISLKHVDRNPAEWNYDPNEKNIIQEPIPLRETWEAMEELVDAGLVKVPCLVTFVLFDFYSYHINLIFYCYFFFIALEYWIIKFLWSVNYGSS
jgi:hypothetical protein